MAGGPLVSPWQAAKLQHIANEEFSAQFALSLALKDAAWPCRQLARTGSPCSNALRTNGSGSSTLDLATRT